MKDDDDSEKYLDPNFNPMLPGGRPERDHQAEAENRDDDSEKYLNGNYNPMIPRSEADSVRGRFGLSPDELQARLSLRYPGVNVLDLPGGRQLIKMADGTSWRLNGKLLSQLDPDELLDLNGKI